EPFGAAYHPAWVPGAGGAVTVIAEEPLLPPVAAVMVAEPMVTPDTRPLLLTVATVVALLDHVIERPDTVLPAESLGVAASCTVCPTTRLAAAGLTVTEAMVTFATAIADVPLFPPVAAVIVAEPAPFPVTSPLVLTVAIVVLSLDQVTTR